MNPGHTYQLPTGEPIAAIMRQMWSEQLAAIMQAVKLYGRQGVQAIDLARWQTALIRRVEPLYRQWILEGQENIAHHVIRPKEVKRRINSPVPLIPTTRTNEPSHVNMFVDVVDPHVIQIARNYAYKFAESTLETTKLKVEEAYAQTQYVISEGLKENLSLEQMTQLMTYIFNDEHRARRIAATESSRAFHYGQLITAQKSGKILDKTWRANSSACKECLELDGKTVPLNEPFAVKHYDIYGIILMPPYHPFCLCSVSYTMKPFVSADEFFSELPPAKPIGEQATDQYFALQPVTTTDDFFATRDPWKAIRYPKIKRKAAPCLVRKSK